LSIAKIDNEELAEFKAALDVAARCNACDKTTTKLCGRCKIAFYCSKECQRAKWPTHRVHCGAEYQRQIAQRVHDASGQFITLTKLINGATAVTDKAGNTATLTFQEAVERGILEAQDGILNYGNIAEETLARFYSEGHEPPGGFARRFITLDAIVAKEKTGELHHISERIKKWRADETTAHNYAFIVAFIVDGSAYCIVGLHGAPRAAPNALGAPSASGASSELADP